MARQSLSRYLPWLVTAPLALVAWPLSPWASAVFAVLFVLGWLDFQQTKQAVRRNYPLTGRLRYALEYIRPELRQYFLENDEEKLPFSRNQRAMVYARSKVENDKRGFGSIKDMYSPGTEWIAHSLQPVQPDPATFKVRVGGGQCAQSYDLSLLNISGMSFGALSPNAVKALNRGAAMGGFAHDTGEGSISSHHREHGGDLIWQIASGYFGCRTPEGYFDPERFALQALSPQVKMIEVKLSQGAKPGHGGVLPKAKVNPEIAEARGVPMGQDCVSPARHSAFSTPIELLNSSPNCASCLAANRWASSCVWVIQQNGFPSSKPCWPRVKHPTSLWWMARKAALGRPPLSLPTMWACRCATGCAWCTTVWWARVCASASRLALRAR
jgi:glutamate synthase domain-containing protein 2